MATVIDELTVELGLDDKKFKAGQQDASNRMRRFKQDLDQSSKESDAALKRQQDGLRALTREATGFIASIAGFEAIKNLTLNTLKMDEATGLLAHNLGMSTEALSAWQTAAKEAGGTAQDTNAGLQSLVSTAQQIRLTGTSAAIPYLRLLGINSVADLDDTNAALLKISATMQHMTPQRAQAVGASAGLTPGLINLLEQGPDAVNRYLDAARRAGVVTEEDARKAAEYTKQVALLQASWGNLGRSIVTDVAPALTSMAGGLERLIEKHPTLTARVVELTAALFGLKAAASILGLFGISVPSGAAVAGAAGGAITGAGAGVLGVGASLIPTDANKGEMDTLAGKRASGAAGSANARALYAKLIAAGISNQQALGIVAGSIAESNLSASAVNSTSGAYGIGQWLGPRKKALMAKYGANPTFDQQADFLISELKGGDAGGASVLGSSSSSEAASNYITKFMRPGKGAETTGDFKRANAALTAMGQGSISNTQSTVTVNGPITVTTRATDAQGVAAGLHDALQGYSYVAQANTGQN